MNIKTFFTRNGIPQEGLSPTVRIRDVATGTLLVTDVAMVEVGDGYYKYDYVDYDYKKEYVIRCDGGDVLRPLDRYTYGTNDSFADDSAHAVWDTIADDMKLNDGTMGHYIVKKLLSCARFLGYQK